MKRINKSSDENELTTYAKNNPNSTWEDFRQYKKSAPYKEIKSTIFKEQSNLCAYCEVDLKDAHEHHKRVEHFRSKSDDNADSNIHLDWFNLLGVCVGGSDRESKDEFPLPYNLSCDSFKSHLEDKEKITDKNWLGRVLFPLEIPSDHFLFEFEKSTGKLIPNESYCESCEIVNNTFSSTQELVQETIRVFNLNCDRLNKARLKVFYHFERQLKLARDKKDMRRLEFLTQKWSSEQPLSFQTTRSILLHGCKVTSKFLN